MSRSVGDLCDRYKAAFLRLSEAGANQWKITEYGEVLESACKATKTCLEESLKYIKTKKNIPDRDTDISGFEYPQEIVGSWEEMYATVKSWFKFMDLNEWNRDYMRKEWLLKVHPLQAKEREMDEAMEDHSKAARNISKFGKMKSSMADLLCRDTI
ncbi:hypothetical protein I302_105648 [Kwoniella bestiolae CBS 10118]|uniref:Uncharacterized protein n=1 Tax=Kwoniella bestiolae CBS 10118 TaxID=1296100 RepID=A0A1B9G1R4_9TREE|nr:hypothetical protein I302_04765 [Kwoniella bestiolae CBS 10118]OCF24955.1 hypothetical protein I302_04765 [Kwoniella bestiolae CBS 10118]